MPLHKKLRQRRTDLGLAQQDVLHRLTDLGLRRSAPTLRDWESGRRAPRVDELQVLAMALETSVSWLVGEISTDARTNAADTPPGRRSDGRR